MTDLANELDLTYNVHLPGDLFLDSDVSVWEQACHRALRFYQGTLPLEQTIFILHLGRRGIDGRAIQDRQVLFNRLKESLDVLVKGGVIVFGLRFAFAVALCVQCEECAYPPCRFPRLARPSMAAYGVDVEKTVKPFGFKVAFDREGKLIPATAWYCWIRIYTCLTVTRMGVKAFTLLRDEKDCRCYSCRVDRRIDLA